MELRWFPTLRRCLPATPVPSRESARSRPCETASSAARNRGPGVITAERNHFPSGSDILDDAALHPAKIVVVGIHEVHAGHKHAVEALP